MTRETAHIASTDFWVKVVGMLEQNWVLIDRIGDETAHVYFVSDASEVFDEMTFDSLRKAEEALRRNGFSRFVEDPEVQQFLSPPESPFVRGRHPNGPIYSSGRFWS